MCRWLLGVYAPNLNPGLAATLATAPPSYADRAAPRLREGVPGWRRHVGARRRRPGRGIVLYELYPPDLNPGLDASRAPPARPVPPSMPTAPPPPQDARTDGGGG